MRVLLSSALTLSLGCLWGSVDAFVVPTHPTAIPSLARSQHDRRSLLSTLMVPDDSFVSTAFTLLGDASSATTTASSSLDPAVLLGVAVAILLAVVPVLLLKATDDSDNFSQEEDQMSQSVMSDTASTKTPPRLSPDSMSRGGVDRRGTLATLVGGAVSFAASDVLLNVVVGGSGGVTAVGGGIYGTQWNAFYQRMASFVTQHEAAGAIASPELLAWVAKSPAALLNPELRAWVAAQRAFGASRQLLAAGAALEEGLVTAVGAAAAAAVAARKKSSTSDTKLGEDETDLSDSAPVISTSMVGTWSSEAEKSSSLAQLPSISSRTASVEESSTTAAEATDSSFKNDSSKKNDV